ncbi:hypothetical protein AC477_03610 [miscellaneous Crenarchaeota group-1 archaeon SG8-32-1]|uniref:PepSY domain-containing protein n=1 Tax=miscellaneous Crenarchaeota group-1 archaeon SG8-32-1 TaxID=1685124 RepID=A0A0M0BUE3_9ARCH|nr:MAG: hypothetical protein AC477_03610 [miscellaneous Crenarchaeota group-1 archaeon SG8-32-1]
MTAISQVPENIVKRKVIVYKARVDPATLKQTAEEMKNELFVKRFSKPKPEDIHVVSVDKHYEPYVLVDAKYKIEYYTKKVYTFEVAEKAKEVKVLGESFKPQLVPIPDSEPEQFHKVVSIEGQELSSYEDKAYFILDKNGNEISPDQVPIAPSEDNPKKILKEFGKNAEKVKVSNRDVLSLAKTKLINRPAEVDMFEDELFQVTEYAIIYNPVYKITFRNTKNKEEKTVSVDGVTAEIIN